MAEYSGAVAVAAAVAATADPVYSVTAADAAGDEVAAAARRLGESTPTALARPKIMPAAVVSVTIAVRRSVA